MKNKKHSILPYIIILLIATGLFIYSCYRIYTYLSQARIATATTTTLSDKAVKLTATTSESTEDGEASQSSYLKVDFDYLQSQNPDIKGWLYQPSTIINYPILQSTDNDYYLHRLTDLTTNSAGSLFIDYRNSPDFSEYLTIVYGHNMKNSTMFGTIDNYKAQSYYDENPVMYLATPENSYTLNLIAGYITDADSETYIIPNTKDSRDEFLENAIKSSTFKSTFDEADIPEEARLVMLSTCSYEYENARFVVIGFLE